MERLNRNTPIVNTSFNHEIREAVEKIDKSLGIELIDKVIIKYLS